MSANLDLVIGATVAASHIRPSPSHSYSQWPWSAFVDKNLVTI